MPSEYFATCPKGTAELLATELTEFGASSLKTRVGGVAFVGELDVAYRACLWSRVANRVLLIVANFPAADEAALYAGIFAINWSSHLRTDRTLAVNAVTSRSQLTHSHYIAQRSKDAIVDQLREPEGKRPNVDTHNPDVLINLYLDRDQVQVAIDLSGGSLHRRGYRKGQGAAPIKENLAAAILLRAHWPTLAATGAALIDPMCGSGTFLIEAAMIAGDIAPGLGRNQIGCARWSGHDATLWATLIDEASTRRVAGEDKIPPLLGFDEDPRAVETALENIEGAGLARHIRVECRSAQQASPPIEFKPGLVVCNPPYGERLGVGAEMATLYREFGHQLRTHFQGWDAALLLGDSSHGNILGIRAQRLHTLFNGALECTLLRLRLQPEFFNPDMPPGSARVVRAQQRVAKQALPSVGAQMFANRIQKNMRARKRWARRNEVSCYRLYDADMPEYAIAIDLYQATETWLHVQEYVAPATIEEDKARTRLDEALAQLPLLLDVPPERVIFKRRQKQRGAAQYERLADAGNFLQVQEQGLQFRVNLRDYLDTGLFLDHRLTRALLRGRAAGLEMLNLFAYTGSGSVYAAAGGARGTTSVDMSATYCAWARQNLGLNGFRLPRHEVIQADCLDWLAQPPHRRYGLIFLDPPSFSNSRRMRGTLDIQRDHANLIEQCLKWLAPVGTLFFSTNLRRFKLDTEALADLEITDRSRDTLPEDFKRDVRVHQCFEIKRIETD